MHYYLAALTLCLLSSTTGFSVLKKENSGAPENAVLHKGTTNSEEFGTLIVGGQEATPGQFPFQVSLQVLNYEGKYVHNCGGVIYDSLHIITAAHCVRGYHQNNFKVIAGAHDLESFEGTEQTRYVHSYVFHPTFNPNVLDGDIAIITLDRDNPLVFNDRVQPVSILDNYVEPSGTVLNSGWGNIRGDGGTENPNKLQFVILSIVDRESCENTYSAVSPITPGMVCAGDKSGGKGACNGDSGGPLICTSENKPYLCGLVSWGMIPCAQSRFPSVYTNVANYADWLKWLLPPVTNNATL